VSITKIVIGSKAYEIAANDTALDHFDGLFDESAIRLYGALVEPESIVLDVGANVGCTTLFFADNVKHVHAFEPSPTTYPFLERNTSGHDNVTCVQAGLGVSRESLTHLPDREQHWSLRFFNRQCANRARQPQYIDLKRRRLLH